MAQSTQRNSLMCIPGNGLKHLGSSGPQNMENVIFFGLLNRVNNICWNCICFNVYVWCVIMCRVSTYSVCYV